MSIARSALVCTGLLFLAKCAMAAPLPGKVLSVYDGDTFTVEIEHWPNQIYRGPVRVRGIDAPEIKGACQSEKDAAIRARDTVRALTKDGITVDEIALDKYGRLLAKVMVGTEDLAAKMIAAGLARPYDGGTRGGWCP